MRITLLQCTACDTTEHVLQGQSLAERLWGYFWGHGANALLCPLCLTKRTLAEGDLVKIQSRMAHMAATLISHVIRTGYRVTLGDAFRDERCPYGSKRSKHHQRRAIDLNLFTPDGTYLTDSARYRFAGDWWEARGGKWGGENDGNHFEL